MTLNISSRKCELIIGSQNWTPWIDASSGIQIGYPEYEMGSGLMPVTGTITLRYSIYDTDLPSNPNYFLNPNQWKRGQTVTIRIANIAGTLTYLPCSGQLLYLLKPTQRPKKDINGIATLRLDVGCRLALDNFPPEPNRNVAGVIAGVSTNRNTIIGNILDYINVPHSISLLPYPIDYPLSKTEGNWVSFAGAIADSAGYYLRCNTAGTVVAEPISLDPSTPIETYVISADEKIWEPSGDISEQPLEKLVLSGVKQNVNNIESSTPQVIVESLPLNKISTFPAFQTMTTLFTNKQTTTTRELVTSNLYRVTETIDQPLCQVSTFAAFQSIINLVQSKITTTSYLLKNGIVYQVIENIEEPLCQVSTFDAFVPLTNLIPSKRTTTTWVKTGDRLWTKTVQILDALCRVSSAPAFESITGLVEASNISDDKDTTGAPTNFGDASTNTITEENLVVETYAVQLAEDPFRQRQRTIDVSYAVSKPQLADYGDRFNKLLTGRSLGFQFGGALTDIALGSTFKPFAQVAVQEGDVIYYPKVDAIQYALNLTECYVLWNGIVVGSAPTSDPEDIARPVTIPFGRMQMNITSSGYVFNDTIFLSDMTLVSTGYVWNVQIILERMPLVSSGYALNEGENPLVPKTITYFRFDEANGQRDSALGDGFYFDASGSGSIASVSGVVLDALPTTSPFILYNSVDSALPDSDLPETLTSLNNVSFIGYSFAFDTTGFAGGISILLETSQIRIEHDSDFISAIVIDSTATEYTLTYSVDLSSLDLSNVSTWKLLTMTVDVASGEIGLELNNMGVETTTCPTSGFATWSTPLTLPTPELVVDEMLIFDTALTTGDRLTLWNSGNFNTYPW